MINDVHQTFANLILLTGARESGKTSLLVKVLEKCREGGIDTAGVISPAVFNNGNKTGIDLLDVRSGEKRRLADLRKAGSSGIMTDRWAFDSQTLEWGNLILGAATPCDLLLVDELGPIELEKGLGLQNGISSLNSRGYRMAIVVIRPELIQKALQLWPGSVVFDIESCHPNGLMVLMSEISDLLHQ